MILLKNLIPGNLIEEKSKFFADTSYNPQFVYASSIDPADLSEYGLPQEKYVKKAESIVREAYAGRNESDLRMMLGPTLSQPQVTELFEAFLKLHNLEKRFSISWSASYMSRTSITPDTIKLKTGGEFRKESLVGVLYHEIGTHALRRINYEQQPWYKRKNKYGFSDYLVTEEGLASLHSIIPHSYKSVHKAALRYLAVDFAQKHSFVELWEFLTPYIENEDRRWGTAIKLKRGLTDTSQPGGFTRDVSYFQGMIEVANWLHKHHYNLEPLYFGKLALADVEKAQTLNPTFKPALPSFYLVDPDRYAKSMQEIAEFNNLLE